METLDIDPNFEPQTRARSNTWPLPRPDNFIDHDGDDKSGIVAVHLHGQAQGDLPGQVPKKNSSRRNAWGNMSYADLITQAIQSSPEKRLTLAQIYEWMVQNVPYFKDKGDSNSSAGWKNSIRHNLSLHNRFMRVQNEGTGKSSWWMINPDAKPGKAARRRATSMETQKYEKKRGRVKKKVEALRNGQDATPSPSSSISEGLDMFPESPVHHGFQLSPDFRPRASSNASSCGRLSPIPAVESDMHDNEVPPLSPIPWNADIARMYGVGAPQSSQGGTASGGSSSTAPLDRFTTDQLVDTLADSMKLGNSTGDSGYLVDCAMKSSPNSAQMNSSSYTLNYTPHYGSGGGVSRGNGDYRSPYQSPVTDNGALPPLGSIPRQQRSPQQVIETGMNGSSYTLTKLQTISPAAHNTHAHSISPTHSLESMTQSSAYSAQRPTPPPSFCSSIVQDSLLRAQVVHKESRASPLVRPSPPPPPPPPPPSHHHQSSTSLSSTASQVMGHLLSLNNTLPQDLDFDSIHGGLECDVDQVIRHELSVDGNLDFNFDPMNAMSASSGSAVPHPATMTTTRSWVH